ncbi:MAG: hypothetical protein HYY18_01885 [Planctomycetes bacterium]|nr:hypothetical protein [Planctomycetota bacterium]
MAEATAVPAWGSSWDEPLFREFMEVLGAHFARKGQGVAATERGIRAGGAEFPLATLADLCRYMPKAQWPRAIAGHFKRIEDTAADVAALEARKDLAGIRAQLRVRIYPERFQETEEGKRGVMVPVAPGIVGVVELTGKGGGEVVSADHIANWGVSPSAVFEAARRNHPRRSARRETGPEFEVSILMGDDEHVATEVLFLDHYIGADPPAGTLVVVPTQSAMVWHEVRDGGAIQALQTLIVVAHQLFERGPGAILPMLYWWRRGKFFMLPLEVQGENIRFSPPVEFVAAMEAIGVKL